MTADGQVTDQRADPCRCRVPGRWCTSANCVNNQPAQGRSQRCVAVRTIPGDIQLTVSGSSFELTDAEALDLALSLIASARTPDADIDLVEACGPWANQVQLWLDTQPGRPMESFRDFVERRELLKPPPTCS